VRQQLGDGFVWSGNEAQAQLATVFDWEDHVHGTDCGDFQQELTRTALQPLGTHPHFQGAPKRQGQKTNQDVGFDTLGFLVVNGSKVRNFR
jgi:hypothetical protein